MDTRELRIQQQILESRLYAAISNLVDDFKARTGESPSDIDVVMSDVSEIGTVPKDYLITAIKVRIEI